MNRTTIRVVQLAVLVVGLWGGLSLTAGLKRSGKLDYRPNPLTLNGSPFGRTLALAMRGPVDVYWHRGNVHDHDHDHSHEHGPDCGPDCDHEGRPHPVHDHSADGHHHHNDGGKAAERLKHVADSYMPTGEEEMQDSPVVATNVSVRPFLLDVIGDMREAYYSRTNDRADSKLHKAFILGETERRLKIGYHMDPTNLSGYGAYFLFLSEALARVEGENDELRVIRSRQQRALDLANYTLQYCLNYQDEAPAMLTAANAAHDYLQIRLTDPEVNLHEAGEFLRVFDACLVRYEGIRNQMIENGSWKNFYEERRIEMEATHGLLRSLRDADREVLDGLMGMTSASVVPED
jgi:hypothetical protein